MAKIVELSFAGIKLAPREQQSILPGLSVKGLYNGSDGALYYVKEPKPRKVSDIFKDDPTYQALIKERQALLGASFPFNPYTEQPEKMLSNTDPNLLQKYKAIEEKIKPYVKHVNELIIANTALEIVAPQLARGIMGRLLITPQNYLFMDENHRPCTASKSVGQLDEFLTHHEKVVQAKHPAHWTTHEAPTFVDLVKTEQHAKILGQAYFVALLMGHLDLVNNINLSNFGTVSNEDGTESLCLVDWGNTLGVGFGGLTAEEGTLKDPLFQGELTHSLMTHAIEDITGYKHVVPFDEVVYPMLPRQVVHDLFDLTSCDNPTLRKAQREGFYQACDQAMNQLADMQTLIPRLVYDTLHRYMSEKDSILIQQLLPKILYQTDGKPGEENDYNLANILEGRIYSLQIMMQRLQAGQTIEEIAKERLDILVDSQKFTTSTANMLVILESPSTPMTPLLPKQMSFDSPLQKSLGKTSTDSDTDTELHKELDSGSDTEFKPKQSLSRKTR